MALLRTNGGTRSSVRSVSSASMRLLWISEILQRMWIIVCVIIMIIADENADCFIFTRPPMMRAKSLSAAANFHKQEFKRHYQRSKPLKQDIFFERSSNDVWVQAPGFTSHNHESWDTVNDNTYSSVPDSKTIEKTQTNRISSSRHHSSKSFSGESNKTPSVSSVDAVRLWKRLSVNSRKLPYLQNNKYNKLEGGKQEVTFDAQKRKGISGKGVEALHNPHDFNQKRDFQWDSFLACPSDGDWVKIDEAYGTDGQLLKVEQPAEGEDPRKEQWFWVVTCNTSQENRPSDCPMCCIGINRARYESNCQPNAIYIQARVSERDPSTRTGWSNVVAVGGIRVNVSCSCFVSPIDGA